MSDNVGENLALIVAAWTDIFHRGSTDALEGLLDEEVVWNGMFPDEICHGRQEVLGVLVRNRPRAPLITNIEAEEKGDQVAVFGGRSRLSRRRSAASRWPAVYRFHLPERTCDPDAVWRGDPGQRAQFRLSVAAAASPSARGRGCGSGKRVRRIGRGRADAFVYGMDTALLVSAGIAVAGLLLSLAFMPAHVAQVEKVGEHRLNPPLDQGSWRDGLTEI